MGARGPQGLTNRRNEPRFERGAPPKPEGLSEVASKKWDELAARLDKAGVITWGDAEALYIMCQAWADYQMCYKSVRDNPLIKTANGNVVSNPMLKQGKEALRVYLSYQQEFGMTPASRSKINALDRQPDIPTDIKLGYKELKLKPEMKQIMKKVEDYQVGEITDLGQLLKQQAEAQAAQTKENGTDSTTEKVS